MTITPLTLMTASLEHLAVRESGQTVSNEAQDKCLRALVSMLDSWGLSPQDVIGLQELTYTPTAGMQSFTIGPAGSIVARQPLRIELSSMYRVNGVDMPLGVGTLAEYNSQANKSATGPPQFVAMERSYATATVYVFPAGDGASQLRLWVQRDVVSGYDTMGLATALTLPVGLQNTIEWCLAEEVAPDFTVPDSVLQRVARMAANAKRKWKRANTRIPQMRMPAGVTSGRSFNINEG